MFKLLRNIIGSFDNSMLCLSLGEWSSELRETLVSVRTLSDKTQ